MTATAAERVNRHFGYDQHSKIFYAMLLLLLRRNVTNLILLSSLFSFVLLKQFNKHTLNETFEFFLLGLSVNSLNSVKKKNPQ